MGLIKQDLPAEPKLSATALEIWECLENPVVVPSPIRTPEERQARPSELTLSFKEIQEQLKRAGLAE